MIDQDKRRNEHLEMVRELREVIRRKDRALIAANEEISKLRMYVADLKIEVADAKARTGK